jgi:hypothetical protein
MIATPHVGFCLASHGDVGGFKGIQKERFMGESMATKVSSHCPMNNGCGHLEGSRTAAAAITAAIWPQLQDQFA